MNSGQTRESKHQIAVLEEEDVETFVAFCEYAYTGDYGVPPPGSREDEEQIPINAPFNAMFPEDTGCPPSAAGLGQAHEETFNQDDNGNEDSGRDEEDTRTLSRQSRREDNQAWYAPTHTEYLPQDPNAVTPRESNQSPASSVDPSPSRGRRRRRRKTDEQGFIQDPTSNLTPPCTPPGAARPESAKHSVTGSADNPHALAAIDQSTTLLMGHPTSTFGNGVIVNESGYEGDRHRRAEESTRSRVRPVIDTSFANQQFSPRHEKGTSLWDEFTGIDDMGFNSPIYRARPSNPPPGVALPYLTFHAKLYIFATRYLIPDLAHLCLQKLHYDLLNLAFPDPDPEDQYVEQFVLTTTKARMVVDLLNYTYTKTTRLEPIIPSSATQLRDNELRRLVVHYAACKVRDLAKYCPPTEPIVGSPFYPEKPSSRGFRALLDTLPELASDLIYRMI